MRDRRIKEKVKRNLGDRKLIAPFSFHYILERLVICEISLQKPFLYFNKYGNTYECNHPVYNRCTLFEIGERGLAIIQQRYNSNTKKTWLGEIDPWLTDKLYLHPKFKEYFDNRSGKSFDGVYPIVTVR